MLLSTTSDVKAKMRFSQIPFDFHIAERCDKRDSLEISHCGFLSNMLRGYRTERSSVPRDCTFIRTVTIDLMIEKLLTSLR